jgi:hypothetical protein
MPASALFATRAERTAAMSELPASSGCDAAIGVDYPAIAGALRALVGQLGRRDTGFAPRSDDHDLTLFLVDPDILDRSARDAD